MKKMKKIDYKEILNNIDEKIDCSYFSYKDNNTKSKLICEEHGEFLVSIRQIKNGIVCKKCDSKKINDTESFIETSTSIHSEKYDYSKTEYINSRTKLTICCKRHGNIVMFPIQHLRGQGCYLCKRIENGVEFIKKANDLYKYNYDLVEYINNKTNVKVICQKHGVFETRPDNHIHNMNGCPSCKSSNGEILIQNFLNENKIEFEIQKKFDNCYFKQKLRFDFYLPYNNICIEYNGIQHYSSIEFFGGEKTLNYNIKKDLIKNDYCNKNNIKLFIIKYDEDIFKGLLNIKKFIAYQESVTNKQLL
jgi:predicted Zn-ribbon and HTH transcriptional regulator